MNLKRKTTIVKVICGLLIFVSVACSTKNEAESAKQTVVSDPVAEKLVEEIAVKPINVISYGVQIGAYKKFDVQFGSDIKNIKKNGLSKYVFGSFKTQKEAQDCLKIMTDLNIKDAFIVKMKEGEIIE